MFYVFVCHSFWTQAEWPYVAQRKMHPKWGRRERGRSTIHYFARSRLKNVKWHTPESLRLLSVNEREATWARLSASTSVSGLSILSSTWELHHLSISNIGLSEKGQFEKKKLAVESVCKLQLRNTHQTFPLHQWVLDTQALRCPDTDWLAILVAENSKYAPEAYDI